MDVLWVSQKDLFVFSVAILTQGALISLICALRDVILNLPLILKGGVRPDTLPELVNSREGISYTILRGIWDFMICVIWAVLLLIIVFVFNDGKLRLFSLLLSGISFFISSAILGKPIRCIIVFTVKLLNKVVCMVILPFRLFFGFLYSVTKRLIAQIKNAANKRRIRKHTEKILFSVSRRKIDGMLTNIIKE